MFCVRCGKSLQSDFHFCPYCGTSVVNSPKWESLTSGGFDIRDGVLVKYNGCASNVTIPTGVTRIGSKAFVVSDKKDIFGSGYGWFGYSYSGNKYISHVIIPDSVTQIDEYAFAGCTNLMEVVLPNRLNTIQTGVFEGCTKLSCVHIPDSVRCIGADAFRYCDLSRTIIPESVTEMIETSCTEDHGTGDSYRYYQIRCYGGMILYFGGKNAHNQTARCKLNTKYSSIRQRMKQGLCRHCGGDFSRWSGKCKKCGKVKDYAY